MVMYTCIINLHIQRKLWSPCIVLQMYLLHGLAVISNRRKYHACNYSCSKYKVYMHFSFKHLALKKLRRCVYISRCKHAIRNHIGKCP